MAKFVKTAGCLAAFLYAQFERHDEIQAKRRRIWGYYREHLAAWAQDFGVRLPVVPHDCEQPFHIFYVLMPNLEQHQALISHLKEQGILSVFHYLPLHLSDMGRNFGGKPGGVR